MGLIRIGPEQAGELPDLVGSAAAGTRVELGPGVYRTSKTVVLDSLALVGAGPFETVIEAAEGPALVVQGTRGRECTLEVSDLTLRGSAALGGGGVAVANRNQLVLSRCVVAGCVADQSGGAVLVRQSGLRASACLFQGNRAEAGGALSVRAGSRALLDRCYFTANEAQVGGALMVNDDAALEIRNCTFLANRALLEEGEGATSIGLLGTTQFGPEVRVVNCLFTDPRPLVNPLRKSGDLRLTYSLFLPGSLERVLHVDEGGNLEAAVELVEVGRGLQGLRPGSRGHGAADITVIDEGAADLLGRPLVVDGEADVGAIGIQLQ